MGTDWLSLADEVRRETTQVGVEGLTPVDLMRACGLTPDSWQEEFLLSPARQKLLMTCRQIGKTESTACLATHLAATRPDSLVLAIATREKQSAKVIKRARWFANKGRDQGLPVPQITSRPDAQFRLAFANGSEIVALPANEEGIRGETAHLIIIDEAARVPDETGWALDFARSATRGQIVKMSTPHGKRGQFYADWWHGGDAWARWRVIAPRVYAERVGLDLIGLEEGPDVPIEECHRVDEALWLDFYRNMPRRYFIQEMYGVFSDTDDQWFASDMVDGAFSRAVPAMWLDDETDEDGDTAASVVAMMGLDDGEGEV